MQISGENGVRMTTSASVFVWAAVVAFLTATASADEQRESVLLKFDVYRIRGDISGTTSLTDNVWSELEGVNPHSRKFPFTVFTIAEQKLGGVEFKADDDGWRWNGEKKPPRDGRIQQFGSPMISSLLGESFAIEIISVAPQYFQPHGKLFELKTASQEPGLSIATLATGVGAGEERRIVLKDLVVRSRFVEKRDPVEGLDLDVGKPIFKTVEETTTLSLRPDRDYGLDIRIPDGKGFLRCRLRVSFTESASGSSSPKGG